MKPRLLAAMLFAAAFHGSPMFAQTALLNRTLAACLDGPAAQDDRLDALRALGWAPIPDRTAGAVTEMFAATYAGIAVGHGADSIRTSEQDAREVFSARYTGQQPKIRGRKPDQATHLGGYLSHRDDTGGVAVWMVGPSAGAAGSKTGRHRFSCMIATDDASFAGGLISGARKNSWDPVYLGRRGDETSDGKVVRRTFEVRDHTEVDFPPRLRGKSPRRYLVLSDLSAEPAQ
ncbi:hypothetical protein [Sulfitobacter sabulilitoris]|uniref:Uncharacterized protein n=1 Tax=Sulfitobacter sabulilitoris TaxID=2562655 RepID=A0A5S3PBA8_9RHOB|nr:hypothetical protein [Sulfitobacter sabulilitoris]TMM50888.1 hypothetical protein FDT80_16685 [Sulfitobacter sabulilitoris]